MHGIIQGGGCRRSRRNVYEGGINPFLLSFFISRRVYREFKITLHTEYNYNKTAFIHCIVSCIARNCTYF